MTPSPFTGRSRLVKWWWAGIRVRRGSVLLDGHWTPVDRHGRLLRTLHGPHLLSVDGIGPLIWTADRIHGRHGRRVDVNRYSGLLAASTRRRWLAALAATNPEPGVLTAVACHPDTPDDAVITAIWRLPPEHRQPVVDTLASTSNPAHRLTSRLLTVTNAGTTELFERHQTVNRSDVIAVRLLVDAWRHHPDPKQRRRGLDHLCRTLLIRDTDPILIANTLGEASRLVSPEAAIDLVCRLRISAYSDDPTASRISDQIRARFTRHWLQHRPLDPDFLDAFVQAGVGLRNWTVAACSPRWIHELHLRLVTRGIDDPLFRQAVHQRHQGRVPTWVTELEQRSATRLVTHTAPLPVEHQRLLAALIAHGDDTLYRTVLAHHPPIGVARPLLRHLDDTGLWMHAILSPGGHRFAEHAPHQALTGVAHHLFTLDPDQLVSPVPVIPVEPVGELYRYGPLISVLLHRRALDRRHLPTTLHHRLTPALRAGLHHPTSFEPSDPSAAVEPVTTRSVLHDPRIDDHIITRNTDHLRAAARTAPTEGRTHITYFEAELHHRLDNHDWWELARTHDDPGVVIAAIGHLHYSNLLRNLHHHQVAPEAVIERLAQIGWKAHHP